MKKVMIILILVIAHCTLNIEDCSCQWVFQNSGTTNSLYSVSIVTDNIAWAAGDWNFVVIRTTNAGINWISATGTGVPVLSDLPVIAAFDENCAVVGTNQINHTEPRRIYRTTDGGQTWISVFNLSSFINGIKMKNQNEAFFLCDPVAGRFQLFKTTNKGLTWDSSGLFVPQYSDETGVINSLFVSGHIISFGTYVGRVYISTNDGVNWQTGIFFDPPGGMIVTSWFFDNMNGLASGRLTLKKTTNGGLNWIQTGSSGTNFVTGVCGYGNRYWIGRGQVIYYSSNSGNNWVLQDSVNYIYLQDFSGKYFNGKFNMWGVGNGGNIIHYGPSIGIQNISSEIPSEYKLYQNYPNPFNPTTKIKFDIVYPPFTKGGQGGLTTLKIFDIPGREIQTLVNEQLNPGTYEVTFDGSNLPSGIYFYRLKAGDYIETKKMLMIK